MTLDILKGEKEKPKLILTWISYIRGHVGSVTTLTKVVDLPDGVHVGPTIFEVM